MGMERLIDGGKMAQINMQSWMFLSSFEKLRTQFLTHYNIDNMLHLGPRTFDELSGEVVQNTAFVLSNHKPTEQDGMYYRLVDGKNCADKERLFLEAKQGNGTAIINSKLYTINYPNVEQMNFVKIPGCPIGYWVSENIINSFQYNSIEKEAKVVIGIKTGDNEIFIRNWYEVDNQSTDFICKNLKDFNNSKKKWFPYVKGGEYRLWYGNQVQVLYWTNNGENMLNHTNKQGVKDARVRQSNFSLYGKEFLTWSRISSRKLGIRYVPQGVMFDCNSPSIFQYRTGVKYILGFLSTYVSHSILEFIAPTLSFQIQDIKTIPLIVQNENYITDIVNENISISRSDWDAHETSWDFQRNELLSIDTSTYTENINYKIEKHFEETGEHISISPAAPKLGSLEWRMEQYKTKWERKFMQLHKNEEELNRQFIDIYGLQDELTPDVPLNEITILQQGEISIE